VALPPGTGDVYLRLRNEAGTYTGWFSLDGTTWTLVGTIGRTLTDPTVGLSTGQSDGVDPPIALFDWFTEVAR
jgi:hypothetical protein